MGKNKQIKKRRNAKKKGKKEKIIYAGSMILLFQAIERICQNRKDQKLDLNFLDIKQTGGL